MSFFDKIKGLLGRKKHKRPDAHFESVHTDYGRTAWMDDGKKRKSKMAKQWAAIMEARHRLGLRTDKAQRMCLRKRLRGGS